MSHAPIIPTRYDTHQKFGLSARALSSKNRRAHVRARHVQSACNRRANVACTTSTCTCTAGSSLGTCKGAIRQKLRVHTVLARAHVRAPRARPVQRYALLALDDVPSQRATVSRGSQAKWAALSGRNKLGLRPTWPTGHVHVQIGRAHHGSISITSRKKLAYGTLAGCGLQPGSARRRSESDFGRPGSKTLKRPSQAERPLRWVEPRTGRLCAPRLR